ncbi:HugZ family protein [Microvirga sp. 17 mud 1-3]|uniref:HugZ family pyridoxamine 5'-phosphate oxidase n=1 Tax=Microvirga sp. 17 mud 1-3 TaxID=2082949 RepID=UPI000D6BF090|nr:DUF2470 domain-containing protein [Microvirga sp. 17 mud 1-3]AWM85294.1 pyridoxamine 5'-phosphate oxidase [Microvirga sp. 17 mud 1-3]
MMKDAFLPVDPEARLCAKALMRTARYGSLATNDRETGGPFASLVSVGTDLDGSPVILTSGLSTHTRLLEADPRCSLLLASVGKGDPLAHPRLTLSAQATRLDREATSGIRERYLRQHPKAALYVDFPDFAFWRLSILSGSLNGGFGRAYRMAPDDLLVESRALPRLREIEAEAVAHMNADHSDTVALYATRLCHAREGAWRLIGLDPEGIQLALGDEILRLAFPQILTQTEDLRPALMDLARRARSESAPIDAQAYQAS